MHKYFAFILVIFAILFASSGCSIMKTAGNAVVDYTQTEAIPYLMALDDVEAASTMGLSMGPVVASFERVGVDPKEVGIATEMAAGMASENGQREKELQKLRALYVKNTTEAQDALIMEKVYHNRAAIRFYAAYLNAQSVFGELDKQCPEFKTDTDELLALLGVASGALGILHDFNAEKAYGIPLDVPVAIVNAAKCFDNEKWWGMPNALKAAIWLSIPGAGPEGVDPLDVLEEAAKLGDSKGVLLPRALMVQMAKAVGKEDRMCQAIAVVTPELTSKLNPAWALLNAYARSMIQHQSDILWTQAQGFRAPFQMIACPKSANPAEDDGLDDLLDDLDDEPAAEMTEP